MRRKLIRQHAVQAQIQIEAIKEAILMWFPVGFAFIGLILHIFPKMTLSA
jgi:hypothetical protein